MTIDPYDININKNGDKFNLIAFDTIIRTSDGIRDLEFRNPVNARSFLEELKATGNLSLENGVIKDPPISWYMIHSFNQMLASTDNNDIDNTIKWVHNTTFHDPIWRWQPGPEGIEHKRRLTKVTKWLNNYGFEHTLLGLAYAAYNYDNDRDKLTEKLYDFIYEYIKSFSPYKLAVWNFLYRNTMDNIAIGYGSIILPLLFVDGILSMREYIDAELVVNRGLSSGWMDHYESEERGQQQFIDFFSPIARSASDYLSEFDNNLDTIISLGESNSVEFKYSLLYNLYTTKVDNANKYNSLKTIVAFLNSFGGKLLIGVDDAGSIVGIENDGYKNNDKFELALKDMIKDCISIEAFDFIKVEFSSRTGKTVCIVTCRKGNKDFFMKQNGEHHKYKRIWNSSQKIQ